MKALPSIQVQDITADRVAEGGYVALASERAEQARLVLRDFRSARGCLTACLSDRLASRWLVRHGNPYQAEIAEMADQFPSGVHALSLEGMRGTTAVVPTRGGAMRLVGVIDWGLRDSGQNAVLLRWTDTLGTRRQVLTWPGWTGAVSGMADGLFAVAVTLPPPDPLFQRLRYWRRGGLPPCHLLRQVMSEAPDYETARRMLIETRLSMPAFFTLAGCGVAEGCVIERTPHEAAVRPAPTAAAGHWLSITHDQTATKDSLLRQQAMERLLRHPPTHFNWLAPPVLNTQTRLAVIAEPKTGFLRVQAFGKAGAVSALLTFEGALGHGAAGA